MSALSIFVAVLGVAVAGCGALGRGTPQESAFMLGLGTGLILGVVLS